MLATAVLLLLLPPVLDSERCRSARRTAPGAAAIGTVSPSTETSVAFFGERAAAAQVLASAGEPRCRGGFAGVVLSSDLLCT